MLILRRGYLAQIEDGELVSISYNGEPVEVIQGVDPVRDNIIELVDNKIEVRMIKFPSDGEYQDSVRWINFVDGKISTGPYEYSLVRTYRNELFYFVINNDKIEGLWYNNIYYPVIDDKVEELKLRFKLKNHIVLIYDLIEKPVKFGNYYIVFDSETRLVTGLGLNQDQIHPVYKYYCPELKLEVVYNELNQVIKIKPYKLPKFPYNGTYKDKIREMNFYGGKLSKKDAGYKWSYEHEYSMRQGELYFDIENNEVLKAGRILDIKPTNSYKLNKYLFIDKI